jgi:predicted Zn-ribbon and HTH transcriptional regulator
MTIAIKSGAITLTVKCRKCGDTNEVDADYSPAERGVGVDEQFIIEPTKCTNEGCGHVFRDIEIAHAIQEYKKEKEFDHATRNLP